MAWYPAVFRGTVTRASTAGVWVRAPARWPGVELGPLPCVVPVVRDLAEVTGPAGEGPHVHTVPARDLLVDRVAPGDAVVVADLGREDYVVIGVIRAGVDSDGPGGP